MYPLMQTGIFGLKAYFESQSSAIFTGRRLSLIQLSPVDRVDSSLSFNIVAWTHSQFS